MTAQAFAALLVAVLGGGGAGAVFVKLLSRPVDTATAEKTRAEARVASATAAASEVDTIRGVLDEVKSRQHEKDEEHAAQMGEFRADIAFLKNRVTVLEERERHMLTRAAVHEAWDQMAFAALVSQNPAHPPPPPLVLNEGAGHDHEDHE